MAPRWFVDESALGLGKLLARVRNDVVFAGHPDLPEIPLGTMDVAWMPIVAERGWVAIRRDRRIHTRPSEVRVFAEVGLRTVWLGGKKDMASAQQLELVTRHWAALERHRDELGPGPWSITAGAVAAGELPARVGMCANYHCNLACTYGLTESAPAVGCRGLGYDAMLEVARQASELGFTGLGVTGGEIWPTCPSCWPSWPPRCRSWRSPTPPCSARGCSVGSRPWPGRRSRCRSPGPHRHRRQRRDAGPNNFAKFVAIPALFECGIIVRIATAAESIADAEQHQMSMTPRARSGHPLTDRLEACPR